MSVPFINIEVTDQRIKGALDLVAMLFKISNYELRDYKEYEITDETSFSKDLSIHIETPYNDLVKKVLQVFDTMEINQKRVMYYRYVKNYSMARLEKGFNVDDVVISSAYYHYQKAMNYMRFTIQEFIAYCDEEYAPQIQEEKIDDGH